MILTRFNWSLTVLYYTNTPLKVKVLGYSYYFHDVFEKRKLISESCFLLFFQEFNPNLW